MLSCWTVNVLEQTERSSQETRRIFSTELLSRHLLWWRSAWETRNLCCFPPSRLESPPLQSIHINKPINKQLHTKTVKDQTWNHEKKTYLERPTESAEKMLCQLGEKKGQTNKQTVRCRYLS